MHLVAGVGALVWVSGRYGADAVKLLSVTPNWVRLAGSVTASVTAFALVVWRWRRILDSTGVRVGLGALAGCRAAGALMSSIVPSGKLVGEPLRILLTVRRGVPVSAALATVTVDRTLEFGSSAPFAWVYAAALVIAGVREADRVLASLVVGSLALAVGVWVAVRRLRMGRGVVSAFARAARFDRVAAVRDRLNVIEAAEAIVVGLVTSRRQVLQWFAIGVLGNVANFFEYQLLLAAFGLPSAPFYVAATIVAAEVARVVPVPVAIGTLEAGQMWLFSLLGFPPDVGLAVGLVLRGREMLWLLPGISYVLMHGVGRGE